MRNFAFVLFSLILSCNCLGQEELNWTGIWQDIKNPNNYFTIHEKGDQIVLIVLTHVDNGEPLKAAYTGKKDARILEKISPLPDSVFNRVYIWISSSTQGYLHPYTDTSTFEPTYIRRVF